MRRFHRSAAKVKMWRSPSDRQGAPRMTPCYMKSHRHDSNQSAEATEGEGCLLENNYSTIIFIKFIGSART